ncbi:MAG: hypothetical protein CVV50_01975 [Spirochaetae bacterium HGW-Spirochaetae-6]|nr:MAG: hypothetical protein CVV50_01975 [Spirochaetae bacterium HGW-Spirochaetae-6]
MNADYFVKQVRCMRENFTETLKKLIGIEEEVEKTVFYLRSLESKEREKVFSIYENYLKNLSVLREDMTSLMQDNLVTLQSLMNRLNAHQNESASKMLNDMYGNFLGFVGSCYQPFFWLSGKKDSK